MFCLATEFFFSFNTYFLLHDVSQIEEKILFSGDLNIDILVNSPFFS